MDTVQHCLLRHICAGKFLADIGRTDEKRRADGTGNRVDGGQNCRTVRIERFRQRVQTMGFAGYTSRHGKRQQRKHRRQHHHLRINPQKQPQYRQRHHQHHCCRQNDKASALFVQQFAEQRRGNCLGNTGRHQNQAGCRTSQHQHLLRVHRHHQLQTQEQEYRTGQNHNAISELLVFKRTKVQQRRSQTELTVRKPTHQHNGSGKEQDKFHQRHMGKITARINQSAEACNRQHGRQHIDLRTADVAQIDRQILAHQHHRRQHKRRGKAEKHAPMRVVDDDARQRRPHCRRGGKHHGNDAHRRSTLVGRENRQYAVKQKRDKKRSRHCLHHTPDH